jgi:hypothetical protein
MFDLDKEPEDWIGLALGDQVQRSSLQHVIMPDQPQYAPITEDLVGSPDHGGDLRPGSIE